MSKCDLQVLLDDKKAHYRPGDEVRGHVQVHAEKDCKCDDLNLSFGWQTHGRGNRTGHDIHSESLFKGEWPAGSQHNYPFRLELPFGPNSYHGTLLNVDWIIQARADVPWALDPKAEQDIILDCSEGGDGDYDPGPAFASTKSRRKAEGSNFVTFIIMLIFMLGGGAFYFFNQDEEGLLVGIFFGALAPAIGLFIILKNAINKSARKKLGNVSLRLEPQDPQAGETLQATLMIQPAKRLKLNAISWTLYAEETVVSGSGTRETTHRKKVFEQRIESLQSAEALSAQQSRSFIAKFALASDAPCSFGATDNKLEWSLKLHVDIPLSPDWRKTYPLAVLPRADADNWQRDDDDHIEDES